MLSLDTETVLKEYYHSAQVLATRGDSESGSHPRPRFGGAMAMVAGKAAICNNTTCEPWLLMFSTSRIELPFNLVSPSMVNNLGIASDTLAGRATAWAPIMPVSSLFPALRISLSSPLLFFYLDVVPPPPPHYSLIKHLDTTRPPSTIHIHTRDHDVAIAYGLIRLINGGLNHT